MVVDLVVVDSQEIVEQQPLKIQLPSPDDAVLPPWSMVSITNYQHNHNIFPPSNHENLRISPLNPTPIHIDNLGNSFSESDLGSDSDSNSNSSSTFSPSDSILFSSPKARSAADVSGRFDSWAVILLSKVNSCLRFLRSNIASSAGALGTFRSGAAFTVVMVAFLYLRKRSRLRIGEESRVRLVDIINEKDEKINQLLDQISRMNQVLLALHKVPTT
ncbi:hypothetical protein ACJIZ3_005390 [Penstemon smallii]|uniref:Transmembrane protein n=1 Tax=Penstemon smallii TaxID=265156 RepID=A0ABD3S4R1_9LAMI